MAKNKNAGTLLSDSDIIKMCEKDKYFIYVILVYEDILKTRNNKFKMRLRVLISKELQYFQRKKTSWFFGVMPENRNQINMIILEYEDCQKSLEVA